MFFRCHLTVFWLMNNVADIMLFVLPAAMSASISLSRSPVHFNVINTSNQLVYMVGDFLYRITEPVLKRIRSVVPSIGGIDLSPLILLVGLVFVRSLITGQLGIR